MNKKLFLKLVIIFLICLFSLPLFNIQKAIAGSQLSILERLKTHSYPRLANYFLEPTITNEQIKTLAKYDLVILDMEFQHKYPNLFSYLRKENPNIVILAYVTTPTIYYSSAQYDPSHRLRYELFKGIKSSWWLLDTKGNHVSVWPSLFPGTWMLDVAKDWNKYLPEFMHREVMSTGLWDGIFYDEVFTGISWINNGDIDTNRDGIKDIPGSLDAEYREGLRKIFEESRRLEGDNKIIICNGAGTHGQYLNGRMFETFPKYNGSGWHDVMNYYQQVLLNHKEPKIVVINANTDNTGNWKDYRKMRYGLTSTLLFDGYYSFDYGTLKHGQTWWYDEYNVKLGLPRGAGYKYQSGVWRRDFRGGIVLCNPTSSRKTVNLGGKFYKIKGTQDQKQNDGALVGRVSLGAKDGIILLRPKFIVTGAGPGGGPHIRSFDSQGNSTYTSFFAYNRNFRGGIRMAIGDVDGDGFEEMVTGAGLGGAPHVRVFEKNGKFKMDFWPFHPDFRGGVDVSCGDVDGDGKDEIAMSQFSQGQCWVKVYKFNREKTILGEWNALGGFEGGCTVALGDINKDGKDEVIVGAGTGGGPQIRIYKASGELIHPGWFVFSPNSKTGIDVALGDVDRDGKDEIAVSQLASGEAWMKVYRYNSARTILGEWRAYPRGVECGANIDMFDIDQDGKAEVLTGAGQGGGPHVRAFEASGQAKSLSFFAYDKAFRGGVSPVGIVY